MKQMISDKFGQNPLQAEHGYPQNFASSGNVYDESLFRRQTPINDDELHLRLPEVGTFDPPSYQELLKKTQNLFANQHHIMAKLSCNGVYEELNEDDIDLDGLIKETLNQPDILFKEKSKAAIQQCKDTYTIQNLIKENIYDSTKYTQLKEEVDKRYQRAECFMHVLTSDDEAPNFNENPNKLTKLQLRRKKYRKSKKSKRDPLESKRMKKRVKKIIHKLKYEAITN